MMQLCKLLDYLIRDSLGQQFASLQLNSTTRSTLDIYNNTIAHLEQ